VLQWPVAAVGDATAEAATEASLSVQLVGPGTGAGLAKELTGVLEPGAPVVLACGKDRREELPTSLEAAGHTVHPVVVYAMNPTPPRELPPLGPNLEAVVVTSPRAARLYLDAVGGLPLPLQHWALGPTTQEAAQSMGIQCKIPENPTITSLAEELCRT
jgi:uroporphyrinogen-III synthase